MRIVVSWSLSFDPIRGAQNLIKEVGLSSRGTEGFVGHLPFGIYANEHLFTTTV